MKVSPIFQKYYRPVAKVASPFGVKSILCFKFDQMASTWQ